MQRPAATPSGLALRRRERTRVALAQAEASGSAPIRREKCQSKCSQGWQPWSLSSGAGPLPPPVLGPQPHGALTAGIGERERVPEDDVEPSLFWQKNKDLRHE